MRGFSLIALIALLAIGVAPVSADAESLADKIRKMDFTLQESSLGCPLPIVGTRCPEDTVFYYFRCCTQIHHGSNFLPNDCCFQLQEWVVALSFLLIALAVLGILIKLLRRILCCCCPC